jgi:hypothetical protein
MATQQSTCESCRFWQDQSLIGTCRRFPQATHKSRAEWCGEYQARLQPAMPTILPEIKVAPVKRKYVRRNATTVA